MQDYLEILRKQRQENDSAYSDSLILLRQNEELTVQELADQKFAETYAPSFNEGSQIQVETSPGTRTPKDTQKGFFEKQTSFNFGLIILLLIVALFIVFALNKKKK